MTYEEIVEMPPEHVLSALLDSSVFYVNKIVGNYSLPPTTMFISEVGVAFAIHSFSNDQEKYESFSELKEVMNANNTIGCCTVVEAWALTRKITDPPLNGRVSNHEDRFEIVSAVAETVEDAKMRTWKIIRAENGTCKELQLIGEDEMVEQGGMIGSLLRKKRSLQ